VLLAALSFLLPFLSYACGGEECEPEGGAWLQVGAVLAGWGMYERASGRSERVERASGWRERAERSERVERRAERAIGAEPAINSSFALASLAPAGTRCSPPARRRTRRSWPTPSGARRRAACWRRSAKRTKRRSRSSTA
jgi:hypothetical protein